MPVSLSVVVSSFIPDMETAVMTQLQAAVLQRSSCLYKVLQLSAELDCLMALAQVSQENGYCSPLLSPHSCLNLKQARLVLYKQIQVG